MMSQKHSAFALMALGSVCVMFTSSAGAVPLKRTQEDVRRIVAQQKAELEANGKATISFYTGDISANYKVVLEGITSAGTPLYSTMNVIID